MRQNRSILFVAIGTTLLIIVISLTYLYLTNPSSDRHVQKFTRSTDQKEVLCIEPPSEAFTKDVRIKLEATAEQIIGIGKGVKGSGGLQFDAEKIVRELPSDVRALEVIEYRICAAYGNEILTEEEYKVILKSIFLELKNTKNRISEMDQTPTQDGRTGIWVARIRGDDDQYSAQRELVQKLRFYLGKESALKNLMDVRELAQEVTGATESEGETLARQLGQRVNAAVVIWGEIAGLLHKDEFFSKITIVGTVKGIGSTIRLEPVTEISQIQEYRTPQPSTLSAAPERVREPIRLVRYVMATQYYKKADWADAADHFEALIQEGSSQNIHDRDLHIFAGYSNWYLSFPGDRKNSLIKAKNHFLSAQQSYANMEKDSSYPAVLNMLGIVYTQSGLFEEAEKQLAEASRIWKEAGDERGYWSAQGNLGANYLTKARKGIDIQKSIDLAIGVLEKVTIALKNLGDIGGYASSEINLGYLYLKISDTSATSTGLKEAIAHFLNATEHEKIRSPWSAYMAGENGLAEAYARLVRFGVDIKSNLTKSIAAREEVVSIYQEHKSWGNYADQQIQIAGTYIEAAQKGNEFNGNMVRAISALTIATAHYKQLNLLAKYADAQYNLAVSYQELARHDTDRSTNLQQMKLALEDGIVLLRKFGFSAQERKFNELLEALNKFLSDGGKHARFHQVSCFQDSSRTKESGPGYSSGTIQSTCLKVEA